MRGILFFVVLILTVVYFQYAESKESRISNETLLLDSSKERGISDVWNNIKNSIKNAWDSIKTVAQDINSKINAWIEAAKSKATAISKEFEEKVKKLREKSRAMLEDIIGDKELLKECLQKENAEIDNLLMQIIKDVTICIINTMGNVSRLDGYRYILELNETKFLDETERKMNECQKEKDAERCLLKVRQDTFILIENMENEILTIKAESRGVVDDLLNAVTTCSIEGLIEAASVIATEAVNIINCIKDG